MDRSHMNIELHGPGRAGGALAIAAHRAGHRIVGIFGRSESAIRSLSDVVRVESGSPDLRVIAVSDDAIGVVVESLADLAPVPTVHLSGLVPVSALAPIEQRGAPIGSFHPLQTLPTPAIGADRLPGAWVAITASGPFGGDLADFARSLGCMPFDLADQDKAIYHAAAASAANYPLAALALAERLFSAAGVPFEASRPLVDAIVANAYAMGPAEALTGPIARGDSGTVAKQVEAVASVGELEDLVFRSFAKGTSAIAGAEADIEEAIG